MGSGRGPGRREVGGGARGGRGEGDARGGRGEGDARGGRGEGDARGGRGEGDARGGRGEGDARGGRGEGDARGGRGEGGERGVAVGAERWAEVQAWRAVFSSLPRVRPYTGNLRAIPQRDLVQSPQRDFGPGSPGDFPGQNSWKFFTDFLLSSRSGGLEDFFAARPSGAPATRQAGTSRPRMAARAGAGGTVMLHHLVDQDTDEDGLDKSDDKELNTPELKAGKKRSAPESVKFSVKKAKTDASPKPEQVSLTGKKGRISAQGMSIGKEAEPPTSEGLKPAKAPKGVKKVGDHKCTSRNRTFSTESALSQHSAAKHK